MADGKLIKKQRRVIKPVLQDQSQTAAVDLRRNLDQLSEFLHLKGQRAEIMSQAAAGDLPSHVDTFFLNLNSIKKADAVIRRSFTC